MHETFIHTNIDIDFRGLKKFAVHIHRATESLGHLKQGGVELQLMPSVMIPSSRTVLPSALARSPGMMVSQVYPAIIQLVNECDRLRHGSLPSCYDRQDLVGLCLEVALRLSRSPYDRAIDIPTTRGRPGDPTLETTVKLCRILQYDLKMAQTYMALRNWDLEKAKHALKEVKRIVEQDSWVFNPIPSTTADYDSATSLLDACRILQAQSPDMPSQNSQAVLKTQGLPQVNHTPFELD